ncbi:MAG: glycosyl hydrolase-related protein, partial [Thermoprotei archaeon]
GPDIATPLSQLNKKLSFDYSLVPFEGQIPYQSAEEFCRPLLASTFVGGSQEPKLPPSASLVSIPAGLVLSALKPSEDKKAVILRAYNPTSNKVKGKISTIFKVAKVFVSNMNEDAGAELPFDQGCEVEVPASGILTLKMVL